MVTAVRKDLRNKAPNEELEPERTENFTLLRVTGPSGGQSEFTTVRSTRQRPSYGVDKVAGGSTLCYMGNFIAKRWTYIDDDAVWVHHVGDTKTGPNYINSEYKANTTNSETKFEYLSADGDPTQEFVTALP